MNHALLRPALAAAMALVATSATATPKLHFERELGGATSSREHFIARGSGMAAIVTPNSMTLSFRSAATGQDPSSLRMELLHANSEAHVGAGEPTGGHSHYLRGSDPRNWTTDVEHFAAIRYDDIYPGIDIVYYGQVIALEFDFVLAPGANAQSIQLEFSSSASIDVHGSLWVETPRGAVRLHRPVAYQQSPDGRIDVATSYVQHEDGSFGFEIGSYDLTLELTIDPMVEYSTYLGANGSDEGFDIAVDDQGNAYVTGSTGSTTFPISLGAFDRVGRVGGFFDPGDVFVTKLDPTGSTIVYSTYISGGGNDVGYGIDIDRDGNAYVVGTTDSVDDPLTAGDEGFPLANPIQSQYGGDTDLFILKLDPTGSVLVYSTYFGGNLLERSDSEQERPDIGVDAFGNAYVAGTTQSPNFTTFNALPIAGPGPFALGISSDGTQLKYSTFLGGDPFVFVWGVAVDPAGSSHIVGFTGDPTLPTTAGVIQPAKSNLEDMFLYKLDSSGGLTWCTYLGGTGDDFAFGVDLDPDGNVYVTGSSVSSDYPITSGTFPAGGAAPITKLSSDGTAILYSFFLGGPFGYGVAVDRLGQANVTGEDGQDVFFAQINLAGTFSEFETFYGGLFSDVGNAIAVDPSGASYITGRTSSGSFPGESVTNLNPLQSNLSSPPDAFVVKTPRDIPVAAPTTTALLPATLHQNRPNPFNPRTTITFDLQRAGHIRLAIYDSRGRQVQLLVDEWRDAGSYTKLWTAEDLASGVYRSVLEWTGSRGQTHRSRRPLVLAK